MTTILQISDFHLLSRPDGTLKGVPTSECVALVLQRAREEVADPACLVLTGDLSHEETVAGYKLLADLLGDWSERSLLVPGNHDNRAKMRQVFEQVPGALEEPIWFRQELGQWVLLGLDSHVPGEVYGELSDQSLERLAEDLAKGANRPTLIFMHHHPGTVGSRWVDNIGLRNAASFEKLLARHREVRGVFCGHIHQVFEGRIADVPFHSAPSAAIQFLPETETMQFDLQPPGFRVIELRDGQFTTRVARLDNLPFTPLHE
ncbi:MAG: phosphodiesterase [Pirellulaceae bacterium]|nr:phosphodiesterase [Pirellulaceae bacterium]HJN07878.1 phosphodiesterase [Pirellulaceae bacterium]